LSRKIEEGILKLMFMFVLSVRICSRVVCSYIVYRCVDMCLVHVMHAYVTVTPVTGGYVRATSLTESKIIIIEY
jgi:hypothetical protein